MQIDNNKLVRVYLKMRAAKSELTRTYEARKAEIEAEMAIVDGMLHKTLLDAKVNSMGADAGTFYLEDTVQPRCDDWQAYHSYLIAEQALDGLEKRVTKSFIVDYMKTHDGDTPPGITVFKEKVVRVRVSNK